MARASEESTPPASGEEVSPELALVDPELAVRARERLPEPRPAAAVSVAKPEPEPPRRPKRRARRFAVVFVGALVGLGIVAAGVAVPTLLLSRTSPSQTAALEPQLTSAGVLPAVTAAPAGTASATEGEGEAAAPARPRSFGWVVVPRATHYRVVFFRGSQRVFEATPKQPPLVLPANWRYRGNWYRLSPGNYRWVVRPGFGPPKAARYGKPVVDAALVVRR